ncbi:SDR family NAD(P)-dependent oxidoreductase, partial [Burkholderia sp. Ac-20379]|uniref:SDR family NAD(P)-dependent oxidoreductase n=1 Tax=Burkholderia sp. Ac-20379 TaxID=2703900 RepID=UPI00197CE65C
MDLQLHGKTALVTGSSKGIGEALARTLAREGAFVVVHGRDAALAARVAGEIAGQGGRAAFGAGDLADDEAVRRLGEDAQARVVRIDVVIYVAGGSGCARHDWRGTQAGAWAAAYDRNVLAAVRVATRLLPAMQAARWGRVINISSLAATIPPPTAPDYSASKAAINALTASMAKAVAADGVTVNAV